MLADPAPLPAWLAALAASFAAPVRSSAARSFAAPVTPEADRP